MTAQDKFKEMGEKLKAESAKTKEENKTEMPVVREEEVSNALATIDSIKANAELAAMYAENAQVGSQNLSSGMPILKVHSTGRSNNELADGSEPNNGWFYYKTTKEQFQTVECHILSISRGFNTEKMGGNAGETTYQHLLSGVMKLDGEYAPFIIYLNSAGHRNKMYEFGKEIHQYTHNRQLPIPMFALTVKLFTVQVPYSYTDSKGIHTGKSWVINYEVVKNPDGTPVLVGDPKEFTFLKDSVVKVEGMIESLIAAKATEETAQSIKAEAVEEYSEEAEAVSEVFVGSDTQVVNKDEEIPF